MEDPPLTFLSHSVFRKKGLLTGQVAILFLLTPTRVGSGCCPYRGINRNCVEVLMNGRSSVTQSDHCRDYRLNIDVSGGGHPPKEPDVDGS